MTAEHPARVLVTGGSGFIGRRLVKALLGTGAEVTVADRREPTEPGVRPVVGDLRDPSVAAQAVSPGTDVIFHLAAITSVLKSLDDPVGTYETNVAVTASLLELARIRGSVASSSPPPTPSWATWAGRSSPSGLRCAR